MNNKTEFRKPLSHQPMSGLVTAMCFDWPTGMPTFARETFVNYKNSVVNYRSCIYSVATVIQREREALTNMAAGCDANALSFL